MQIERTVAYFSMEIALEAGLPTCSSGLGVLAGDTIRSAADLKMPMVAVYLLDCDLPENTGVGQKLTHYPGRHAAPPLSRRGGSAHGTQAAR